MAKTKKEYDVIVVGSGIGGCGAAALLAKEFGKQVLVLPGNGALEPHDRIDPRGVLGLDQKLRVRAILAAAISGTAPAPCCIALHA